MEALLDLEFCNVSSRETAFLNGIGTGDFKAQCRLPGNPDIPWEEAEMMRDYYR